MREDSQTAIEIRHVAVLIEQILSQNRAVIEAVSDTNKELCQLDVRVGRLEAAV